MLNFESWVVPLVAAIVSITTLGFTAFKLWDSIDARIERRADGLESRLASTELRLSAAENSLDASREDSRLCRQRELELLRRVFELERRANTE